MTPIRRKCGNWDVAVEQLDVSRFRAIASFGNFFSDWATGFDVETALRNVADKIGLDQREILEPFGL